MADGSGHALELHDYLPFGEELLSGTDGRENGVAPNGKRRRQRHFGISDWILACFRSSGRRQRRQKPAGIANQYWIVPSIWILSSIMLGVVRVRHRRIHGTPHFVGDCARQLPAIGIRLLPHRRRFALMFLQPERSL